MDESSEACRAYLVSLGLGDGYMCCGCPNKSAGNCGGLGGCARTERGDWEGRNGSRREDPDAA